MMIRGFISNNISTQIKHVTTEQNETVEKQLFR